MVRLVDLQGHDLLFRAVPVHVVGGGGSWRAGLRVLLLSALILAVVQSGERQNVEEQQRSSHCDGYAQLGGVIPWVLHQQRAWLLFSVPLLLPALAVVGWRHRRPLGVERPGFAVRTFGGQGVLGRLGRWHFGGGGGVVEHVVKVVQMRDQVLPERHFSGTVVIPDSWLEADVQVQLVLRAVFGPGYLFEAIGLSVDELGVLRHWFVGISAKQIEDE